MRSCCRPIRVLVAGFLVCALTASAVAPLGAQDTEAAAKPARGGASWAEKIAFAWLLGGGIVLAYYGPQEKENGQLTRDGKSEAIAGWVSIGISVALLHDILKRRTESRTTPPAAAPASTSRSAK